MPLRQIKNPECKEKYLFILSIYCQYTVNIQNILSVSVEIVWLELVL